MRNSKQPRTMKEMEEEYLRLERAMADPLLIRDKGRYAEVTKSFTALSKLLQARRRLHKIERELEECASMLDQERDEALREEIRREISRLERDAEDARRRIALAMAPENPLDAKNLIMEIRAGTGGEEASLFAADLFRMYARYCERQGWKVEILSGSETGIGGFKEIIFSVAGKGAYKKLKYEMGVHRVQRIPVTEASGRIHTSAVTVAVLPEAEETEIRINPEDLRVDVYRSQGHGGQSVNTTDSAVRITHLPTGAVVTCQDEKSQHKNKDKAMRVLRARLFEMAERKKKEAEDRERRSQIGTGDRSERVRTYNFPQNRVTDHRIGLTLYKLEQVIDGEIDDLVEALGDSDMKLQLQEPGG